MTQEEKAKAYDEVVNKLKGFMMQGVDPLITRNDVQDFFPELAESEDEKIRKELIGFLRNIPNSNYTCEEMALWLEKQSEQKHTAEEVLIKAGLKPYKDGDQWCVLLGDNIQEGICGFGNTIEDALYAFLKDLIASQGEQKSADGPKKVEGKLKKITFPRWSEEDEIYANTIRSIIYYNCDAEVASGAITWLKSLKERVQPQNITVTDEELAKAKKEAYNDALDKIEYHSGEPIFDDGWDAAIWYLKKRNAQPQNTWKPSEEQMRALNEVINICASSNNSHMSDYLYARLVYLRGELKKLKG